MLKRFNQIRLMKDKYATVEETSEITIERDPKEFKQKDIAKEKDTSIKGVEFGKEAELEKDFTEAVLVATEEKCLLEFRRHRFFS